MEGIDMKMKWEKKGFIFSPRADHSWNVSHTQLPTVDKVNDDVLRVYYGTRDKFNRTVITYIEVEADNPQNILYVHDKPVLGLGELGCFDDSGAIPSWIVNHGDLKYFYYVGSNPGVSVSYRNSLGLAISKDNGQTFTRLYKGPIVDRTKSEPHFIGAVCVIIENDLWRMWYLATIKWVVIDNKPEPVYHLKYAESSDGVNWDRPDIVCIDLKSPDEGGVSRPCVIHEDGIYKMWYSYRGIRDYRTNKECSYRIGYAESGDGIKWERKDDIVGIDVSEEGWDSIMVCYAYVYEHKGKKYMIYNGNGFGKSGFGYAILG
jgi:hypothetical protein